MPMFKAKPVVYDFIPNDEKFNKNNGFCVSDVFISLYKNQIKKLTLDKYLFTTLSGGKKSFLDYYLPLCRRIDTLTKEELEKTRG